jgi:hypothetical protein
MAALSVAEALILLLLEKDVLKTADIVETLESCADPHRISSREVSDEKERRRHAETAQLIERLMLGRNFDAVLRRS